mgnify:CR=1 FL=1
MIFVAAFIALVLIIVVFHELGHYWMGRLFGTEVEAFSIGFGPKLFSWHDRLGTEWKVCLLPIGGYVKFSGDANSTSLPDTEEIERLRAQMISEGRDPRRIFQLKPIWQRFLIVLAGPIANFVLAIAVFMGCYSILGEPNYPVVIEKVVRGMPAEAAGLQSGDRVEAVDGWKIYSGNDFVLQVITAPNVALQFTIDRAGKLLEQTITPAGQLVDVPGQKRRVRGGRIGVELRQPNPEDVKIFHHGLGSAALRGVHMTELNITRTFYYLRDVITGQTAPDQLSGPLGLAKAAGEQAKQGIGSFIFLIGLVSVGIGLVNLFPIPVLDGGHLLFYTIEAIQGRPLSRRVQEISFRVGLALLLALFAFVTWNDVLYHAPWASGGTR